MTFDHSASCWKARKVTCNATFLLSKYVSKKSACLPHSDLEMEELAGQERVSRFEDLVSRLAISDEEQERWSWRLQSMSPERLQGTMLLVILTQNSIEEFRSGHAAARLGQRYTQRWPSGNSGSSWGSMIFSHGANQILAASSCPHLILVVLLQGALEAWLGEMAPAISWVTCISGSLHMLEAAQRQSRRSRRIFALKRINKFVWYWFACIFTQIIQRKLNRFSSQTSMRTDVHGEFCHVNPRK